MLGALLLCACGFHPRGSLVAVDGAGRLYLDVDRELTIEEPLRAALIERAFALTTARDEAEIVLRVSDEVESQRIVSVRSTGRVSEFELAHAVRMSILRAAERETAATTVGSGRARPPVRRLVVTREYTYDESQVLGKENEARILKNEMSEELVRQIVLRTVATLARQEGGGSEAR